MKRKSNQRWEDSFETGEAKNNDGKIVAHVAEKPGTSPAGFEQWELTDKNVGTVAQEAAKCGTLPDGFDRWDLRNSKGTTALQTVHEEAKGVLFPADFAHWVAAK